MTPRDVLRRLAAAGCKAEVDPAGRLLVRPAGRITDDLRAIIRQEREAIVRELRRREVESTLRRVAAELGLPLDAMREHSDGLRPEDVDELIAGWNDGYRDPGLLRTYLTSIAHRLAIRCLPAINRTAA